MKLRYAWFIIVCVLVSSNSAFAAGMSSTKKTKKKIAYKKKYTKKALARQRVLALKAQQELLKELQQYPWSEEEKDQQKAMLSDRTLSGMERYTAWLTELLKSKKEVRRFKERMQARRQRFGVVAQPTRHKEQHSQVHKVIKKKTKKGSKVGKKKAKKQLKGKKHVERPLQTSAVARIPVPTPAQESESFKQAQLQAERLRQEWRTDRAKIRHAQEKIKKVQDDQEEAKQLAENNAREAMMHSKELQELIARYNPSRENCRATRRMNQKGESAIEPDPQKKLIVTPDGMLVCMLAGYKNVGWLDRDEFARAQQQIPRISALLQQQNIRYFVYNDTPHNMWFYRPEGRTYALLDIKCRRVGSLEVPRCAISGYYTGHFLSYEDRDIQAFYGQGKDVEGFERDRKKTLEWIADSTPGIEEWFANNRGTLGVTFDLQP